MGKERRLDAFLRVVTYLVGGRRVSIEGDILAYLNQKEFPTYEYIYVVCILVRIGFISFRFVSR